MSDTPLGIPSHHQYEQGLHVLRHLEKELLGRNDRNKVVELTNQYYTLIPHAFSGGRQRPPLLDSDEAVQAEIKSVEDHLLGHHHQQHQHPQQLDSSVWQFDSRHGWFDFDLDASQQIEDAWRAHERDPNNDQYHQAEVKSGPDGWRYSVNFDQMTETNLDHERHRVRNIRRVPASMSRRATPSMAM
ncbi:uncharacterized protein ACA1_066090 [Acanthamoeba castellanii str. Neff]|uniref:NAD(+) ADP-ribosyltransferase n=1 Tax=Acanthamoeba castellanii (strain ATCC 30010 / Neff) TaxID=1257118 RepID=L8GZ26_ACACF|nr:uncharacterized protein ACA1_066090 [Acanthamoeba castellanii str. Neff]ELR17788.1 hypothetical protein ACA1_066090 [Acanthamoeba castellanii str. Neff]